VAIEFFIPGIPRPGGSKRGFVNPRNGRVIITDAGGSRTKDWRGVCATVAKQAMNGLPPFVGPLRLTLVFVMPRPKSHYRKAGLKPDAETWHRVKPDRTKLTRAMEDALTGIVWRDDCIIVAGPTDKVYGESPGARVRVEFA
jgi:crossover junction endodeoxyribonuclease RusA